MVKSVHSFREDILNLRVEKEDGLYRLDDYQSCESIGYLLKRAFALLTNAIDQKLAPFELTHSQFSILMMLKEHRCSTAAELARLACIDTGSITRMLDRLEAKQLIARHRSEEDRRLVHIVLTDFGKLIVEKMPVVAINVLNDHFAHFDAEEVATLKILLRKLLNQPAGAGRLS